ncbi:MAG: DUF5706 domain-containing protein [Hyphomicrobiales bacterium]|nr:DUF5706 domain-containing protein [Hyphomicrobiales bacterium]
MMERVDYLFKQYENILDWYKQAESKSTLLHTINGLLVGAVNGLVFVGADKVKAVRAFHTDLMWGLLLFVAVCVICSYLCMLRAVWARHRGAEPSLSDKEKLWFFGHVGQMPAETYKQLLSPFNIDDIEATMLAQNHILSRNVAIKFDALNWAISLTITALVVFFVLGVVYTSAVFIELR